MVLLGLLVCLGAVLVSELSRGKRAFLAVLQLCSSCTGRELSCAAPELGDGLGSPGLAGVCVKGRTACICDPA